MRLRNIVLLTGLIALTVQAQAKPKANADSTNGMPAPNPAQIKQQLISGILNQMAKSGCTFSVSGKLTSILEINRLNLNCAVAFQDHVKIKLLEATENTPQSSHHEKFETDLVIGTKGLVAYLQLKKQKDVGTGVLQFYTVKDYQRKIAEQQIPQQTDSNRMDRGDKNVEINVASRFNPNIAKFSIGAVDIKAAFDPKNQNKMKIQATCRSEQTSLDIFTARNVMKEVECKASGVFELGQDPDLNFDWGTPVQALRQP